MSLDIHTISFRIYQTGASLGSRIIVFHEGLKIIKMPSRNAHQKVLNHFLKLSDKILYEVLHQGASKLPMTLSKLSIESVFIK